MRTKRWLKKRSSLDKLEHHLKEDLSNVSNELEDRVKKIALVSLAVGTAGFMVYQFLKKKDKEDEEHEDEVLAPSVRVASGPGFKQRMLEKLAMSFLNVISARLAIYLARKFPAEDKK